MGLLQEFAILAAVIAVAVLVLGAVFLAPWRRRRRDLRGKVVLLTGAGGGLGRVLARQLARRGCRLACVDIAAKPNEETVALVQQQEKQHGEQVAKAYTADLTKREDIYRLVERVIEDFGHIDILLSNAGQLQGGALWELTDAQLDMVLDVNLRATLLFVKALVPHMRARGEGHIVAVSSSTALLPSRGVAAYAGTKSGLSHAMECLYLDLRHEGLENVIHVTTVQPFFISTFARLGSSISFSGPVGSLLRFLDPEEVARRIEDAIAARKHVVSIPAGIDVVSAALSALPRCALAFLYEHVVKLNARQPFAYEHRHRSLDAALLHELLSKDYPLEEDPAAVCAGLCADFQGRPLPYDFSPFSHQVAAFYAKRGQGVPRDVMKVFRLAH